MPKLTALSATAHRLSKNHLVQALAVILPAAIIFALRNLAVFKIPNFHAEDATVIFNNIYTNNPLRVLVTPFNGYLIVGQYLLGYIAVALNWLIGNGLDTLPTVTAVVSCVFLGFTASLPFLLFRKELGTKLSLAIVLFTALVPLKSFDYAIIGTFSNTKFAFLYIAFMLLIYRLTKPGLRSRTYVLIDAGLLLCVFTNVTAAFLIPVIPLAYLPEFWHMMRLRRPTRDIPVWSGLLLTTISLLYVAGALLRGIPEIPGYLDGPFRMQAFWPVIERSTTYAWLYPITSTFNDYFVIAMLAAVGIYLWYHLRTKPRDRIVILLAVYAVALGTGLFVLNRPGIGDFYLTYNHKGGPDQFFYAQNMIVIFLSGWLFRHWLKGKWYLERQAMAIGAIILYLLLALPHGTSYGGSAIVYKEMKTIYVNLDKACAQYSSQPKVIIQIYPTPYWQWTVDKNLACHK